MQGAGNTHVLQKDAHSNSVDMSRAFLRSSVQIDTQLLAFKLWFLFHYQCTSVVVT